VLSLIAVGIVSTALVWTGGTRLERAADRLAAHYALPPVVQGAVIVAIGSSTPELLTAVLAPLLHAEFELGVAVIVGSAVFNILVIPAAAALSSDGSLNATPNLVYKEAQFYLLAVSVFVLTLALAVVYYPVDTEFGVGGDITRSLALVPVAVYGLYVFIQYEDTLDHDAESVPGVAVRRQWLTLVGGFVLIALGVEGLIRFAVGLGDVLGTESFVWGLTVIAAATSLPDAVVSVTASRRQNDVTSIANVFGSNVFDLLVAVPAGVLAAGVTTVSFLARSPSSFVPRLRHRHPVRPDADGLRTRTPRGVGAPRRLRHLPRLGRSRVLRSYRLTRRVVTATDLPRRRQQRTWRRSKEQFSKPERRGP